MTAENKNRTLQCVIVTYDSRLSMNSFVMLDRKCSYIHDIMVVWSTQLIVFAEFMDSLLSHSRPSCGDVCYACQQLLSNCNCLSHLITLPDEWGFDYCQVQCHTMHSPGTLSRPCHVFVTPNGLAKFKCGHSSLTEASNPGCIGQTLQLLTVNLLYLENGTRAIHSFC